MEKANPYLNNVAFSLLMLFSFVLMLSNAMAEILALTILLIWTAQTLAYRRTNWLEFPLTIPIAAFIVIKVMALAVNGCEGKINPVIESMALPLIYFIVPGIVVTAERRRKVVWLTITGAVVASAIGIFKLLTGITSQASSVVSGSSTLAVFLTFVFVLVLSIFAYSVKFREKVFLGLVTIPLFAGIIFAFNKASYAVGFLVALFFGLVKDWKILILLLIVITSVYIISIEAVNMINEKVDLSDIESVYPELDSLMAENVPMLKYPGFFGYGYNCFNKVINAERQPELLEKPKSSWNNLYTNHLIDSGPFSLFILLWILISQLRYSFAMLRRGKEPEQKIYQLAFVVIVICFMFFGLFFDPLSDPIISMLFWFLMGLSLV